MTDPQTCACLSEPQTFDNYEQVRFVGIDTTHGRFGEVSIRQCRICGRLWLHYFVEYEAITGSGRYFMGLLPPEQVDAITAESAVEYLNGLEWHIYGGSYFRGGKGRNVGEVFVDG